MKLSYKLHRLLLCLLLSAISIDGYCFAFMDTLPTKNDTDIVANGAVPVLISKQFKFTEGPTTDKKGNVFFTDQPNDKIWKYDTKGKLTVFLEKTGRSNGMDIDKKGNLYSCADEQNQILKISPKGKVTVLLNDYEGKKLNGPNDLWIHPNGDLYFTDPFYVREYWTRKQPEVAGEKVYYLAKGKTVAVPVIDNFRKPNGIVGTPDGQYLYVADIAGRKTFKYKINADGTLGEAKLFAEMGSDGMEIDNRGNIYMCGRGVTVFNPQGKKIKTIPIPERSSTTNVTFAGKKRDKLFITNTESIYILDMKVKGVK